LLSGILPNTNDNVTINPEHILTIPSEQIAGAGTLNDLYGFLVFLLTKS
jgi:hypothetical protein